MTRSAPSIGTWITVPHPTVVDLMCDVDLFDWLCVDMEHSPTSLWDLQVAVTIIQGRGKKAFVRVRQNTHADIKFALDTGVDGIIIPMVNSAEDARLAVQNCHYPPRGRRGVGLARAQRFGFAFDEHLKKNADSLKIIVQVEHIDAVRQIDDLLRVDGVTGVFVGPYDLSGSMGIPGRFDSPEFKAAIARVSDATIAADRLLGMHVILPSAEKLQEAIAGGYSFIAFSIDTYFLGQKIRDEALAFKLLELGK